MTSLELWLRHPFRIPFRQQLEQGWQVGNPVVSCPTESFVVVVSLIIVAFAVVVAVVFVIIVAIAVVIEDGVDVSVSAAVVVGGGDDDDDVVPELATPLNEYRFGAVVKYSACSSGVQLFIFLNNKQRMTGL